MKKLHENYWKVRERIVGRFVKITEKQNGETHTFTLEGPGVLTFAAGLEACREPGNKSAL